MEGGKGMEKGQGNEGERRGVRGPMSYSPFSSLCGESEQRWQSVLEVDQSDSTH